jgi:hypothetical protein
VLPRTSVRGSGFSNPLEHWALKSRALALVAVSQAVSDSFRSLLSRFPAREFFPFPGRISRGGSWAFTSPSV